MGSLEFYISEEIKKQHKEYITGHSEVVERLVSVVLKQMANDFVAALDEEEIIEIKETLIEERRETYRR
jgi:3-oxoacyl-ACP reductase-like protein